MGRGGLDWCASGEGQWSAVVNTVMNSGYHNVWGFSLLVEERELFKQGCVACCSYVILCYIIQGRSKLQGLRKSEGPSAVMHTMKASGIAAPLILTWSL